MWIPQLERIAPVLKTSKLRFWLACFVKDLTVGTVFEPGLLHVTIMPWFVTEVSEADLLASFAAKFSNLPALDIKLDRKIMLGPRNDMSVSLVTPSPDILNLHTRALEWFGLIDARWAVKDPHVGDEYIPHIRRRPGTRLNPGQTLNFSHLYLIKAHRHEDNLRVVAARTEPI